MKILRINPTRIEYKKINEVIKVLKKGGTVVYPTDTAYALGGDFFDKQARRKIYDIKGRSFGKVLPAIVASPLMARRVVKFDRISWQLARKYWPGPLTLVLPVKKEFVGLVENMTLALRVPQNKVAILLSQKLRHPIVSTSANISGGEACYSIKEVLAQFKSRANQPDLILDIGTLTRLRPSTIIEVRHGKPKVLREGPIKV